MVQFFTDKDNPVTESNLELKFRKATANVEVTFNDGIEDMHKLIVQYQKFPNSKKLALINSAGTSSKNTALHNAAITGNARFISFLSVNGADFFMKNSNGKIPLEVAKDDFTRNTIATFMLCQEATDFAKKIFIQKASHKSYQNAFKETEEYTNEYVKQLFLRLKDVGTKIKEYVTGKSGTFSLPEKIKIEKDANLFFFKMIKQLRKEYAVLSVMKVCLQSPLNICGQTSAFCWAYLHKHGAEVIKDIYCTTLISGLVGHTFNVLHINEKNGAVACSLNDWSVLENKKVFYENFIEKNNAVFFDAWDTDGRGKLYTTGCVPKESVLKTLFNQSIEINSCVTISKCPNNVLINLPIEVQKIVQKSFQTESVAIKKEAYSLLKFLLEKHQCTPEVPKFLDKIFPERQGIDDDIKQESSSEKECGIY